MSPKKSKQPPSDVDLRRVALLVGSLLLVLLVAPVVYRITMKLIEQDHEQFVNANLLAFIVTTSFCAGLLVLTNTYFKYFSSYLNENSQQLQATSRQPAILQRLFGAIFTSRDSQSAHHAGDGRRSPFYEASAGQMGDQEAKRKIDSKYFKPKFIIHELMTFWGTTCTVITWGSFYIIGGTVVMSERLAQKIKAKSGRSPTKEGGSSSFIFTNTDSRGTGQQSDFSFSSAFGGATAAAAANSGQQAATSTSATSTRKPPFQRISSWTRRSVLSIRKKFSRTVRNNHPQLTTGPANDSSSNIFFFGNTSAATS